MEHQSMTHHQDMLRYNNALVDHSASLQYVGLDVTEQVEAKKDDRPFHCETCGNRFRQQCHLQQHIRIHTNNRPYHCSYCEKKFKQKSQLDQHERIHTGEKPYQCPLCEKAFPQAGQLYSHKKTHGIDPKSNRLPKTARTSRKRKSQECSGSIDDKRKVTSPTPIVYLMESFQPKPDELVMRVKLPLKTESPQSENTHVT